MINMPKFAETLSELLFDKNMDAKTFAAEIGVKGSTVTRYLRGERMPTVESLVAIADYFGCTADYLLGREENSSSKTFKTCPPFSEQIVNFADRCGLTCFGLSQKANIHQSRVYAWKSGKRVPSLDNIIKLAEFFDCSVDFVIGRES
ncbi:MAG: helix-turn-helix domain-containing protein [Clostridia bacterium]|nr:helix-turn-helix domain-containing protein [Clostridia bacterium]